MRDHRPKLDGKPLPEITRHRFDAHRTKVRRPPESKRRKKISKLARRRNR